MSSKKRIRNLAHFTSLVSLSAAESGKKIFRIFKVYHPLLEAQLDIEVKEVSASYHILEKFMDLIVCGKKEDRNPSVARVRNKDELLALLGINYEGYEIASLYFDDLVNEGHFDVRENGIFPLDCAELSLDTVDLENLYKSLKEEPAEGDETADDATEEKENVKLEYKYTEKMQYQKKLFDQYSLELMPEEFYGQERYLTVSPEQKKNSKEKDAVWLSPGIKMVDIATAISESLDSVIESDVSFVDRGIPSGTHRITLAPDTTPSLIFLPYYLVVYRGDEGELSFAVHEALYGGEVEWMSQKYNSAEDEKNEYLYAKNLISSICRKQENCTVYSPIFADWPLKIGGRIAYEYGYRECDDGNYIWQMQPWQLPAILKKCENAEQRLWVEFALESDVCVLDSYEAGRLVHAVFPEDLREKINEALKTEPERPDNTEEETALYDARDLFIKNGGKAEDTLKKLSETSDEANFLLGRLYLENRYLLDLDLSIEHFKKAREMGYIPAAYFLCIALVERDGADAFEEIRNILAQDEPNGFAPTLYALSRLLREEGPEKAETLKAKAEISGYFCGDTEDILCSDISKIEEDAERIKAQEEAEALSRIEEAADKKDAEEAANEEAAEDAEEKPKIPYNEPHFSKEVDKTVSFGENLTLNADEIIKTAAENHPKKEFTDEEYKIISRRLWGEYTTDELKNLTNRPKQNLYNTKAFVSNSVPVGLCACSRDKKPACFKSRSVAPTYSDFVEYSKVTSADFLKNLSYVNTEEFFALDPDPFSKIIPEYKNAPKISDRHDLSYRYAPFSAYFEDPEFEELRKAIFEGFKNNTRYETFKNFRKKHILDAPTQNKAIMLFWTKRRSYTTRLEQKSIDSFSETLTQNGEISHLLKKADLLLCNSDAKSIKDAKKILALLTPFSGHAHFLTAQISRRSNDIKEYTKKLLLARSFCSPYAFDITDNASPYGDFKEFSSAFRLCKRMGEYHAESSDISSYFTDLLYYDPEENYDPRDSLAYAFLDDRDRFLYALETALKKELENTSFLPALSHGRSRSGFAVAAAMGGVVAAENLADKLLRKGNYAAAENCLTFAASRGNISAAKSLVNFYLTAENWNPKKACYVLDRICDVDPSAMALYVLLFKLGLDTEITQYREIVQVTRNIISKF